MKTTTFLKIFCIILLSLTAKVSNGQSDKEAALEKGRLAIKLEDERKFEEAILLLEEAKKLDPENYNYPYELGYIYYAKENYKKALDIYKSLLKYNDITDQCYQMLGNTYDMLGDSSNAIKTYDDGIKLFPNSAILYLEKGNIYWNKKMYGNALPFYEKGIVANPSFPSNYYKASRIYCASSERIWGVSYGEIFMNIERNSERTKEVSEILFDTYKDALHYDSDSSAGVSFSKVITVNPTEKFKLPFSMVYELTMMLSFTPHMLAKEKQLTIKTLHEIRTDFINKWFSEKKDKEYPNILFDYQKQLIDVGNFEAYNYWIFMKGSEDEFISWKKDNQIKWDSFVTWYTANKLKLTDKNKFSSSLY